MSLQSTHALGMLFSFGDFNTDGMELIQRGDPLCLEMDSYDSQIGSYTTVNTDNAVKGLSQEESSEPLVFDAIPNYLKTGMLTNTNNNVQPLRRTKIKL